MPNIIPFNHRPTKDVAARLCGLKTFDNALPQQWLDATAEILMPVATKEAISIYDLLASSIVWSYDQAKIFGAPHPLTLKAWGYLKALDRLTGSHCVDEESSLLTVLDIA
jgi:hypothetical protein